MSEPQAPSAPRGGLLGPLKQRAPLVLVALVGFFLWKGGLGLLPTERLVIWKLPVRAAALRQADLQLWKGEALLKRVELELPNGLSDDPAWKLLLRPGRYPVKAFLRSEGESPRALEQELIVGDEEQVVVRW